MFVCLCLFVFVLLALAVTGTRWLWFAQCEGCLGAGGGDQYRGTLTGSGHRGGDLPLENSKICHTTWSLMDELAG